MDQMIKNEQALAQPLAQTDVLGLCYESGSGQTRQISSPVKGLLACPYGRNPSPCTLPFDSMKGVFTASPTNSKRSSITKHRLRKPNTAIASTAHDGLCVGPYSLPCNVSVSERTLVRFNGLYAAGAV